MEIPGRDDSSRGTTRDPAQDRSIQQMMLAALLVLAAGAALHATSSVTMPLAFALFLVVLFTPLLQRLRSYVPKPLAVALTFIAMLGTLGGLGGAMWMCAQRIAEALPKYRQALSDLANSVTTALGSLGLPLKDGESLGKAIDSLGAAASSVAGRLADAGGGLVLVVTFAVLAMSETDTWQRKLRSHFGSRAGDTAQSISERCRRYVITRTLTSALTGLLTGLLAWAVGVDLAYVWAVLAFVLNYIPTLGSLIAIAPPTLLAITQLGGLPAFGFFVGLTLIQLIIGSFLDPKLQGKSLRLSPFVVLFSIGLWGWLWGVGGALLGVPLTVAILAVCERFPRSQWIAQMLADLPEPPAKEVADAEQQASEPRAERRPSTA